MTISRLKFILPALFVALFTAGLFSVPAAAQVNGVMTVIRLQQLCASPYDVDTGLCAGYVTAIAETILRDSHPSRRVCLSPAIGPDVLVQNVQRAWAEQSPSPDDMAVDSVEAALRSRFRCP